MFRFFASFLLFSANLSWIAASPISNKTFSERTIRSSATYAFNITECPSLSRRNSPPSSVHDLRPDDFHYTMAIGDSITAGAFLRGIQASIFDDLTEWRGQSYAAGMDEGAVTIPNFIKHYNPDASGGSIGHNEVGLSEVCFGLLCLPWSFGWHAPVAQLNAARTGAQASNLLHEVNDYLIPQVSALNIPREKFKYINFQIGSNEVCFLCTTGSKGIGSASAAAFEENIRHTLEAIRGGIPNTLVNLVGVFKISSMYSLTLDEPYCQERIPFLKHWNLECPCALLGGKIGEQSRDRMDDLAEQYNQRLIEIARDYQEKNYPDFAVVWQPSVVTLGDYPIEALSNVDCHHPSLQTHELFASGIWNRMVGTKEEKEVPVPWSTSPQVRCLQEDDRILTNTLLQ